MFSRHKIIGFILLGYLLPVLLLSLWHADATQNWSLLGIGLLTAVCGTFLFFWQLLPLEQTAPAEPEILPEPNPDHSRLEEMELALKASEQQSLELKQQLEGKENELEQLLAQQKQQSQVADELHDELQSGFAQQRQKLLDEMDRQQRLLAEHHQTILEQREALQQKQQQMTQLENKVRDLNYELKTILQITEKTISIQEPAPVTKSKHEVLPLLVDTIVPSDDETAMQLKRCLDIAQSMTGASHYGVNSRFREFSAGHYALDQRRLFDRLRTIQGSTIFVFAPKENRMLFVNDKVKLLLGLTADRFTQGFPEIFESSMESWNEAMRQLTFKNEVQLSLILKSRFSEEIEVDCLLGIVPTGLFRNQVIGLLYVSVDHLHARSNSI